MLAEPVLRKKMFHFFYFIEICLQTDVNFVHMVSYVSSECLSWDVSISLHNWLAATDSIIYRSIWLQLIYKKRFIMRFLMTNSKKIIVVNKIELPLIVAPYMGQEFGSKNYQVKILRKLTFLSFFHRNQKVWGQKFAIWNISHFPASQMSSISEWSS